MVALEQAVAAPVCSSRLRHGGARVIKIERSTGDFARAYDRAAKGESSYFTWTNQGKESLTLDIKADEDQALFHRLLSHADVFIQNLAPGALGKLNLDSETLRQSYPRLITCDISGYGESEAASHLKAYDLLVQAESGLVSISGGPGEPGRIGISLCDIGTGVTAHAAILEALIKRGITGKGSALKVSLFDVAAEWMTVPFMHAAFGQGAPTRQGLHHPSIAPYGAYRTADQVDTLISIQNEREWAQFCRAVLQDESVTTDPLFASNNQRINNRQALDEKIYSAIGALDAQAFRQRLIDGNIAYGGLNDVNALLQHVALRHQTVRTTNGSPLKIPAHPWSEKEHSELRSPKLGEHTAAIYKEFSGR